MDLRFFEGEPVTIKRKHYTGVENEDTGELEYTVQENIVEALLYFRKSDGTVTPYEVGFDTELTVVMPNGTVILNSDVFVIRGKEWETNGIVVPISGQAKYDRFMKPPTVITLRQHKGNVDG